MRGSSGCGKGEAGFQTLSPHGGVIYDCDKMALHLEERRHKIINRNDPHKSVIFSHPLGKNQNGYMSGASLVEEKD